MKIGDKVKVIAKDNPYYYNMKGIIVGGNTNPEFDFNVQFMPTHLFDGDKIVTPFKKSELEIAEDEYRKDISILKLTEACNFIEYAQDIIFNDRELLNLLEDSKSKIIEAIARIKNGKA